jgi:hypothetical protein
MEFVLRPWHLYLLVLAGWINRQQQEVVEYLRTEIRNRDHSLNGALRDQSSLPAIALPPSFCKLVLESGIVFFAVRDRSPEQITRDIGLSLIHDGDQIARSSNSDFAN